MILLHVFALVLMLMLRLSLVVAKGQDLLCDNSCGLSQNLICDDSGSGSFSSRCNFGTDCFDCGERYRFDTKLNPRVFVWVPLRNDSEHTRAKVQAIAETWGSLCDKLVFFHFEDIPDLQKFQRFHSVKLEVYPTKNFLWEFTKAVWRYVFANCLDSFDWFMEASDESYVMMKNLYSMLGRHSHLEDQFFGNKFSRSGEYSPLKAQSAYVISREALRKLVTNACLTKDIANVSTYIQFPMEEMIHSMKACDVPLVTGLGFDGLEVFLPYSISKLRSCNPRHRLWSSCPGWALEEFDNYPYPGNHGENCCSRSWISSEAVSFEKEMYMLHFLVLDGKEASGRHPSEIPFSEFTGKRANQESRKQIVDWSKPNNAGKLLVMLPTEPGYREDRIQAIIETWGSQIDKLLIVSPVAHPTIETFVLKVPNVKEGGTYWRKMWSGLKHIYDRKLHLEYDWVLKVDDDSFINPKNLRSFLAQFNTNDKHFFSSACFASMGACGSCYVLSRTTMQIFGSNEWARRPLTYVQDDDSLSRTLRLLDIDLVNALGPDGKRAMLQHPPNESIRIEPVACCSGYWATSHYFNAEMTRETFKKVEAGLIGNGTFVPEP